MDMGMGMFFNVKSDDIYLLFKAWYPTTPRAFVFSCFLVMLAAMCEEVLKKCIALVSRQLLARRWTVLQRNALRALLTFVHSTLSYA